MEGVGREGRMEGVGRDKEKERGARERGEGKGGGKEEGMRWLIYILCVLSKLCPLSSLTEYT